MERVILFSVAVGVVVIIVVFAHLLTADFNCPRCGHLNAEHWSRMVIARRCRVCNRWCRIWMG